MQTTTRRQRPHTVEGVMMYSRSTFTEVGHRGTRRTSGGMLLMMHSSCGSSPKMKTPATGSCGLRGGVECRVELGVSVWLAVGRRRGSSRGFDRWAAGNDTTSSQLWRGAQQRGMGW